MYQRGCYEGSWIMRRVANPRMALPYLRASKPSPIEGGTKTQAEGMPLGCLIVVLTQLIADEADSRPVGPHLLCKFVSMVLCAPNAQLVGLSVDAFQPLVHLEHLAKQSLGVIHQPEQLGVALAQQAPIYLDLA